MEQSRKFEVVGFETVLVVLHRREMRLRSVLSSALTSPEDREAAALELETILQETREVEDKVTGLEKRK
jgi:hypothetical protein